ncbi:MAG: surface polysaccharide biosynthesis protein [uncultured bacterium]|nr:MAG: surface polysaccharide biosynthesis protein [uncultured bacterium]
MKSLVFAITGANGQIGSFLTENLRKNGHIVYELVRSPEKAKDKKYYRYFDLSTPDQMPSLFGIDVMIHSAHYFNTTDKDYEKINVLGAQKLFEQAKRDNLKYAIFISTISAFPTAHSLYGRTKYQLEQLLQDENIAIVRPGLVFHQPLQGIIGTMDKFVVKYPVVPLIGKGDQLIYPCFLDELTKLILMISVNQPIITKPIIAAAEQSVSFKQLIKYLARQRQKKILLFPTSFNLIYSVLKTTELFGLSIGLRSDSLLGLQFSNNNIDFSETRKLGFQFNGLRIQ